MTSDQAAVIVEDLFLTDNFLIKGRIKNKYQRLNKVLEDCGGNFLHILDASMVSLRSNEVIRTPSVLVNPKELVLAHELVDVAGDESQKQLADKAAKRARIRAFYSGAVQMELTGFVEHGAYEREHNGGRSFFTMIEPRLRGVDVSINPELGALRGLGYAIVQKARLAYVYDFG